MNKNATIVEHHGKEYVFCCPYCGHLLIEAIQRGAVNEYKLSRLKGARYATDFESWAVCRNLDYVDPLYFICPDCEHRWEDRWEDQHAKSAVAQMYEEGALVRYKPGKKRVSTRRSRRGDPTEG